MATTHENCYELLWVLSLFFIMEKNIIHIVLTLLSITAIIAAFYERIEFGAASGYLVGVAVIAFFYLVVRYIKI